MNNRPEFKSQNNAPRPNIRGSTLAAWSLGLLSACLAGLLYLDTLTPHQAAAQRATGRAMAAAAGLTDPALFNEARYARNGALADPHAPFQDHPMALEHFPAGSLMPPPVRARLD